MTIFRLVAGLATMLALTSCGSGADTPKQQQGSVARATAGKLASSYSATGTVTAIDADRVTIAHGPVAGLGWPAMTMTFRAPLPDMIAGLTVGERISFAFTQQGDDYALTSIDKVR